MHATILFPLYFAGFFSNLFLVDACMLTEWAEWGPCMGSCLLSLRSRNRDVKRPSIKIKDSKVIVDPCPSLYQIQQCQNPKCDKFAPNQAKNVTDEEGSFRVQLQGGTQAEATPASSDKIGGLTAEFDDREKNINISGLNFSPSDFNTETDKIVEETNSDQFDRILVSEDATDTSQLNVTTSTAQAENNTQANSAEITINLPPNSVELTRKPPVQRKIGKNGQQLSEIRQNPVKFESADEGLDADTLLSIEDRFRDREPSSSRVSGQDEFEVMRELFPGSFPPLAQVTRVTQLTEPILSLADGKINSLLTRARSRQLSESEQAELEEMLDHVQMPKPGNFRLFANLPPSPPLTSQPPPTPTPPPLGSPRPSPPTQSPKSTVALRRSSPILPNANSIEEIDRANQNDQKSEKTPILKNPQNSHEKVVDLPLTSNDSNKELKASNGKTLTENSGFTEKFANCSSSTKDRRCCAIEGRERCGNGERPQKVLRWYRQASQKECTSYNYFYCGFETELQEQPIKFEQDCYNFCFNQQERRIFDVFKNLHFENGFRVRKN